MISAHDFEASPRGSRTRIAIISVSFAFLLAVIATPSAQAEFGITSFTGGAFNLDGTSATQAAGHPGSATTTIAFPTSGFFQPDGNVKDVEVDLPPGFVANPLATPTACTTEELFERDVPNQCPMTSQVGVASIYQTFLPVAPNLWSRTPVFNMAPPPGAPAMIGFVVQAQPVLLIPRIRTSSDYGATVAVGNIASIIGIAKTTVTIWGNPADHSHDPDRGNDGNFLKQCANAVSRGGKIDDSLFSGGTCSHPAGYPPVAFLTNASNCSAGAQSTTARADSWQQPGKFSTASFDVDTNGNPTAVAGCNQVPFEPGFDFAPTINQADSPTGLDVDISMPSEGLLDPDAVAQANLRRAVVTLPAGLTVNPSSADGLGSCSSAQIGLTTPIGQTPIHFTADPAKCPDASRIGAVEVDTPLLEDPLLGSVYLASQNDNPFNSLLALYISIADPSTGIVVKLAGHVVADSKTGQLTATFDQNPQVPFEDFRVNFFGGSHASLRTPATCGTFTTATNMTPWSSPETANATPSDSFEITQGAGGGPCVGSEDKAPNNPVFSAGTVDPSAGAYTPFVLKLARADGSQPIKGIDTTLPKGLAGKLAGIPYCSDAALAAAAGKSGKSEQASPSCPLASDVGTVNVAAGAGPAPLSVGAKAYLAGPYKGAPLSLAIITPAVAGPFDLGTVVVRTALYVNSESAQIHAVSDQIPTILQGIPLDVRSISLNMARPKFTLNPTSCDPMAITGSALSAFNQSASLSNPFQVGDCGRLAFKPKLSIKLKGGTKRSDYPALTAVVNYPDGAYANIARASVALPHSEFLANAHIGTICTRVQFAADQCPVNSVYGFARAFTPLLDNPLEGPVYLRSSDHELPDLVTALHGQIDVDLVGRIDSVSGGIRTSFEGVPDAPVSKFVLMMKGGKKGLLVNSRNICNHDYRATAQFDGQNGKAFDSRPRLANNCKKAKKKHRGKHHKKG